MRSRVALATVVSLGLVEAPAASAQYFRRNQVQYRDFHFQVLKTEHFDVHYDPEQQKQVEHGDRGDRGAASGAAQGE
jgi:hypothetical protein